MPHPTVPCAVRHPEGGMVALDPKVDYDPADPLVLAYPWAFVPQDRTIRESVQIEQASAAPGEKRTRSK